MPENRLGQHHRRHALVRETGEDRTLLGLRVREIAGYAAGAGGVDDGSLGVRERLPLGEVHGQVRGGIGLVPPWVVVQLGDAVEAELLVHVRQRELGGVDGTLLQGLEDLPARQHGDGGPEALDDLAAQPGEADLQAFEVVEAFDRGAEPAGGLGADQPAQQRLHVVLGVQRFGEFATAGFEPPGRVLPGFHAERHGAQERRSGNLALVVTQPGVPGLHLAFPYGVDDIERRHDLAGLKGLEDDGTV